MMLCRILLFAACSVLCWTPHVSWAQQVSSKAPPLSPADTIKSMQIQDGYRVVPVLTEPHIHEPSAIAWDGNGRMYVVEMRTYMQDIDGTNQFAPTSRVSRHEDTDGDGIYDRHTVFADKLVLPRMVLPLLDRVLIRETNTLDIKSYQDSDGDGVADRVELVHKGGPRGGNLEHQPSGLVWNVDNWLYTAMSPFRYRVVNGRVISDRMPASSGQWGLAHDNVGRLFFSFAGGENPAGDFQQPLVYGQIRLPGEQAPGFREVFPIDNIPDTQGGRGRLRANNTLNRFTASCGQSIYRGDRLPADFQGDLIICEPVGRLIRRAKVTNDRGKIVVSNAYDQREFIAARDPNFRPINSATGPDGCLYLVDMYRGIIQEGNWVRNGSYLRGVVKQYELEKNIGRGRIYRVEHQTTRRGPQPRMLDESPAQLVAHLSHSNGWWRSQAQKLLILHGDRSVIPALRRLARDGAHPLGRMHAFWTLEGLDAVDAEFLASGFRDRDPRVRSAAMRISEAMIAEDRSLDPAISRLASDTDPNVAIQVMLSVGRGGHPEARVLADRIVNSNKDNPTIRDIDRQFQARMEAIRAERRRIEELRRRNKLLAEALERGQLTYMTLCVNCHGRDGQGRPAPEMNGLMLAPPLAGSVRVRGHKERLTRVLLNGLIGPIDGKSYAGGLMLPLRRNSDRWIADVATYVRNSFGNSASLIEDVDVRRIRTESQGRTEPWTLAELARFDPPPLEPRSGWKLTSSHHAAALRSAIDGNRGSRWDTRGVQRPGMWFAVELPQPMHVTSLILDTRGSNADYPRAYQVQVSDDGQDWGVPVVKGRGHQPITEIELSVPRAIRHIRITQTGQSPNKYWSIHELTIKGISEEDAARPILSLAKRLLTENPQALAEQVRRKGDALRGARLFFNPAQSCVKCHAPTVGKRLGPDLAAKRQGVSDVFLVESVLRPSKDIRQGFESVVVVTGQGLVVSGFPIADDGQTLVLREPAAGQEIKISKADIEETTKGRVSLMPPGLANQLADRQQFLDLVRFLMDVNQGGPARFLELQSLVHPAAGASSSKSGP